MSKSTNNQIIKAEYFPSVPRHEIAARSSFSVPVRNLSSLGSACAVVASEIVQVAGSSHNSEGLYRCVFPEGVTGKLATFKDHPEYNLGTIINENGLAGQSTRTRDWFIRGKSSLTRLQSIWNQICQTMRERCSGRNGIKSNPGISMSLVFTKI